ncbi:MAG: hypothetical protein KDK33_02995 [Leptospiraceae bacterium]|nr:hypothetical protein [Leptospiraceae bacterium]
MRLARTIEEARKIQIKIRNEKAGVETVQAPSSAVSSASDNAEEEDYYAQVGSHQAILEKDLLDDCVQEITKIRERQQAVLNALRNSRVFEQDNYDGFSEIARKIDSESWQTGEEAINYHKELYSYPRPVTHYLNRLTTEDRRWVESLGDEESRLDLVRKLEMYRVFHSAFQGMYSVTTDLKGILEEIPEESMSRLAANQTMSVRDALPSLEIVQENCLAKMAALDEWKHQIQS